MSELNRKDNPDPQELTDEQRKMLSELVESVPKSNKRCLIYCGDRCDCDAARQTRGPK